MTNVIYGLSAPKPETSTGLYSPRRTAGVPLPFFLNFPSHLSSSKKPYLDRSTDKRTEARNGSPRENFITADVK